MLGLKVAFRHPPTMIFLTTPGSGDLLNFVKAATSSGTKSRTYRFQGHGHRTKRTEKTLKARGLAVEGRRGQSAIYLSDPNGYQIDTTAIRSKANVPLAT